MNKLGLTSNTNSKSRRYLRWLVLGSSTYDPFLDGNKRIGSFLFLLYQRQEGIAAAINENTLTALALLIAESDPVNKDLMIRLVVNLLAGK